MLPNQHNTGPGDDLRCEMERLPVKLQKAYSKSPFLDNTLKPYVIYNPMDNLLYLELEYEKSQRETPTRSSLR